MKSYEFRCFFMVLNGGIHIAPNVGTYMTTNVAVSQLYDYECRRYMTTYLQKQKQYEETETRFRNRSTKKLETERETII